MKIIFSMSILSTKSNVFISKGKDTSLQQQRLLNKYLNFNMLM